MEDRTWELMQDHLDAGSFFIVSSQDLAPSRQTLVDIAKDLDCVFPEEFLVHATNKCGGVYIEVKEDIWPRPKKFDVGPFWSFLYGLFVYSTTTDIPEFMDIYIQGKQFQEETSHIAVPFMIIIGDADVYCFDHKGNIVRWNHELNTLEHQNKTFFELFEFELRELRDRKEQKIALADT